MAITQTIATLPAVLNDSATFYEDIAERNNSLVTIVLPSINAWATQANLTQAEINAKALQVAAQAVDGGYSQDYINTNFVGVNNAQNITAVKTFTVSPIVPTPTTDFQAATKKYADLKQSKSELSYNLNTSTFIANALASGAVIERGSNANGQYIKFADGTMICHMQRYLLGAANANTVFTFPHEFASNAYQETWGLMSQGGNYMNTYSLAGSRTTTSITIVKSSAYEETAARIIVIGNWK